MVVAITASLLSCAKPGYTTVSLYTDTTTPKVIADPDTQAVILATRIRASVAGEVSALKFYRSRANVGDHVGYLWNSSGKLLATAKFPSSNPSVGWNYVLLSKAVKIAAGQTFVVGYLAPKGRYAADPNAFTAARSIKKGPLTAVGSSYSYSGTFPTDTWEGVNYYVDVNFTYKTDDLTAATTTTRPATTTTTARPTTTTTTRPATTSTTTTTAPTSTAKVLSLPKIPWAGGPAYWAKFPDAVKAGWNSPNFFPVGIFWATWSNAAEVQYDKAQGINFYTQGNTDQDACLLQQVGGMSWVDTGFIKNLGTCGDGVWPGVWLSDEIDGRETDSQAFADLQSAENAQRAAHPGKFVTANFTQGVIQDGGGTRGSQFMNTYTDAVSIDQYWFTHPYGPVACWWFTVAAADGSGTTCRPPQNYGRMIDAMREVDAKDGKLQPLGDYVENHSVDDQAPNDQVATPAQIKAATMSNLIHGAGMLLWFNTSFSDDCYSGNLIRDAQYGSACAQAPIKAMREIDTQVKDLAPVLNTQSYKWTFGTGLDTMLKVKGSTAYIFAMTSGQTGSRTFTLPAGTTGNVTDEAGRTLTVSGGKFTDTFETNTEYHIYRVGVA